MDRDKAVGIFRECGALLEGHFGLASGRHSDTYLQCARVLQHPRVAAQLCDALAASWRDAGVDVVVGPATGGIIIAFELARQLGARALFMERADGRMTLRRSFTLAPGEKVLVAEDVMTTGGSVAEVVEAAEAVGGEVVGVACLVDRGGLRRFAAYRTASVLALDLPTYRPEDCALCRDGVPLTRPGSKGTASRQNTPT